MQEYGRSCIIQFWHSLSLIRRESTMSPSPRKPKKASPTLASAGFSASLGSYQQAVDARMKAMQAEKFGARFWAKDSALWASDARTAKDVSNRLGWLSVLE